MNDPRSFLSELLGSDHVAVGVRAVAALVLGLLIARLASAGVGRLLAPRSSAGQAILARRFTFYALVALTILAVLRELGFDLSLFLGAAGLLTVALGFAAQTSASNLISGIFLIGERPFSIGDAIRVGETVGEVISIDLMSVKLRSFDNLLVRIPNETLLRSEITNLTYFPIRRVDVRLGVAYKEDLTRVKALLLEVAERDTLCLDEPKPLVLLLGFGDSSVDLQFSVWAAREHFLDLKNRIHEEIKRAFDAAGVEIPFPHRSLYAGSASEPFPVRIVAESAEVPAAPSATSPEATPSCQEVVEPPSVRG